MTYEVISIETAKKLEKYDELLRENKRLKKENSNLLNANYWLNSRINKAIEYINNNSLYEETYDYNIDDEQELQYVSDETATNDLLNILKGDNK